jgi:EpsI family protein
VVIGILLILTGSYKTLHADLLTPLNRPFSGFPQTVNGWQMSSQDTFSSQTLEVLKPTDYLARTYTDKSGTAVQLYIGYHGGGEGGGEIHSPKHCLPGSGWQELASVQGFVESQGVKINLVKAVYKNDDRVENFYYWFQVRNRTISDEYSLKIAELTGSLLQRRRDAAFIRITLPASLGAARSAEAGERFIKDFYPVIRDFLPR